MATRWEITKAVRASDLAAPARLVMLVLADVAEVGTAEVPERFTPSVTVLERETGLSRRCVQDHLTKLEDTGWLKRTYPDAADMRKGDRVRYQLMNPMHRAQEMHQPNGTVEPSPTSASAPDASEVVQEMHQGDAGDAPLYTDHSDPDQNTSRPRKRGTRIPDDFRVTDSMRQWAKKRVPELAGRGETEKFIEYWTASAAKTAVKVDWPAAWRFWMLKAASDLQPRGRPPSTAPPRHADESRCAEHPDQPADNCRHCRARRKAKPRGGDP